MHTSESWILRPEAGVLFGRHTSALRFATGCCRRRRHVGSGRSGHHLRSTGAVLVVVMMVVRAGMAGGVRRRRRRRVGPSCGRHGPLILLAAGIQPQRVGRRRLARKFERRRLSPFQSKISIHYYKNVNSIHISIQIFYGF